MSATDAGYGATGGMRKSSAATTTPLFASGSLMTVSLSRSPRHHAPPCSSATSGNGPAPRGLKRRARSGRSPWRTYSTSSTSIAWVAVARVAMMASSTFRSPRPAGPGSQARLASRLRLAPRPRDGLRLALPPIAGSLEGRHHLVGQDTQGPPHLLHREEAARVQLGHDAAEPELFPHPFEAIDQARGRAERDASLEDVLVRQVGELLEPRPPPITGSGVAASDARSGQLGVAAEEIRDVLVGLVEGLLLRGRGVDGDAQADVAVAGVPGLPPGRAVRPEVAPELRDVHVAEPDEERQSGAADEGERLHRVGGHPHGRMGELIRPGPDRDVLEPVELPLIAERPALPRLPDDLEGLDEALLALGVGNAERVVRARGAAAADPEVEAPLAQLVHGRDVLGDPQRVAQRKNLDRRADADAPRAGGDEARQRDRRREHRARRVEVDLAETHAVEAPGLRRLHEVERLAEPLGLAAPPPRLLDEDPEVHGSRGP